MTSRPKKKKKKKKKTSRGPSDTAQNGGHYDANVSEMDIASESSDYELENNQATLSEAEINTFLELGESEELFYDMKKMVYWRTSGHQ